MKALYLLARMRVLDVLRTRSSAAIFLVFPVILQIAIGLVFINGHPFERRHVVLVGPVGAPGVELVLARFPEIVVEHEALESAARGRLESRMASAVITVNDGRARVLVGPRERLFGRGLAGELPPGTTMETTDVPRFGYVHFLFPGVLTFSTLVAGLFGMGYSMVRFRQSLFLKKLATTSLRRSTFVTAQILARGGLVILQTGLLVIVSALVFHLPLTPIAVVWIALVSVLGLVTFMGVGFALACVVESEGVMNDIINAIIVPLVFLSEIFFSAGELPRPLPAIASALPSTQMVRLIRAVLLQGVTSPGPLLPGLAVLTAWAVVTYAIGLRAFRWHHGTP